MNGIVCEYLFLSIFPGNESEKKNNAKMWIHLNDGLIKCTFLFQLISSFTSLDVTAISTFSQRNIKLEKWRESDT